MSRLTLVIGPGAFAYPTPKDAFILVMAIKNIGLEESEIIHRLNVEEVHPHVWVILLDENISGIENKDKIPKSILHMADTTMYIDADGKQTILKDRTHDRSHAQD